MARPASANKQDNEKKKQSKRLEKQKKKEDRKLNNNKGASLDEMFVYVDANGQLTSTPPELQPKLITDLSDIQISTPKKVSSGEPAHHRGIVDRYNDSKGFGFIKDLDEPRSYFFHISAAPANIKEGRKVFFDLERGTRDLNAVNIQYEEMEPSPIKQQE